MLLNFEIAFQDGNHLDKRHEITCKISLFPFSLVTTPLQRLSFQRQACGCKVEACETEREWCGRASVKEHETTNKHSLKESSREYTGCPRKGIGSKNLV